MGWLFAARWLFLLLLVGTLAALVWASRRPDHRNE